jgi:medium-chain acyl-[acyl-carrier-protein] hydrolase
MLSRTNSWFFCRARRPNATLRMFCLPYAGAGASVFNSWSDVFPDTIELIAVQLPGRESRYREPMFTDISETAKALAISIEPYLDRPYALFGYSMGALMAFELMRELRHRGALLPIQLFVAARRAPQNPPVCPPIAHLSLDRFLEMMRDCYDPPQAAWELPELLEILLPTLRSDISMCEGYIHRQEPPFECPIHAFAGRSDRCAPPEIVQAWREQTTGDFDMDVVEGTHFFINTTLEKMQSAMVSRLEHIMRHQVSTEGR